MKRMRPLLRWSLVSAVTLFVAVFAASPPSQAATLTFNLTSDHCTGGCLTGQTSGGTVQITDTAANTVQVTVTLANNNKFVSTGFQTDFGFNLTGSPTITYTSVTAGFAATGGSPQTAGSRHMDGAGDFQYGVTCTACGPGGSN